MAEEDEVAFPDNLSSFERIRTHVDLENVVENERMTNYGLYGNYKFNYVVRKNFESETITMKCKRRSCKAYFSFKKEIPQD